jgi:DNA-binding NarL/FixJ family response regulator
VTSKKPTRAMAMTQGATSGGKRPLNEHGKLPCRLMGAPNNEENPNCAILMPVRNSPGIDIFDPQRAVTAMPAHTLRIVVVDDHEVVRTGLRALLQKHAGWEVCGEACDGNEALVEVGKLLPDVVIMDVMMPELNGLEAARRISSVLPKVKILMVSMYDSEEMLKEALEAGAHGYVLKLDVAGELAPAIDAILKGRTFISRRMTRSSPSPPAAPEATVSQRGLTGREREVLQLLAEGKSSKEVASALNISIKTADTHRMNIMQKLDLHSVADLTRYAIRNRIVQP